MLPAALKQYNQKQPHFSPPFSSGIKFERHEKANSRLRKKSNFQAAEKMANCKNAGSAVMRMHARSDFFRWRD